MLHIVFSESSTTCLHYEAEYLDGESWTMDDCTTCTCSAGLVFCAAIKCEDMNHNCGWMGMVQEQCCPVCRGWCKIIINMLLFYSFLICNLMQ